MRASAPAVGPVPSWVTDGWNGNNPGLQLLARVRYHLPVTTLSERTIAAEFVAGESFPCRDCGKFAFPSPTLCFWCRR